MSSRRVFQCRRWLFHYHNGPLSNVERGFKMRSSVFTKRKAFVSRGEIEVEIATLSKQATKLPAEIQVKDIFKIVLCNNNKDFY